MNQGVNQHPMSCPHVFPSPLQIWEVFLCLAHQCSTNAPKGWSMAKMDANWLRGSGTSVSQDCCMGCCPYMCETPAQVLAIRFGAEACFHSLRERITWLQKRWLWMLRRHDGLAAILSGITQETLLILTLSYDLEQLYLSTCSHSNSALLVFYFWGSDCLQVHPKGTLLSL